MTTKNINLKAKELKELQIMADELNAEIEAIKDELKQEMSNRNVDEIVTSEYKIRYKEVTSNRFDTKGLRQNMKIYTISLLKLQHQKDSQLHKKMPLQDLPQ